MSNIGKVVLRFRDKASGQGYWEIKEIVVCVCVLVGCREGGSEREGGPYADKGGGNMRAVRQSGWREILS
jgi:hypothetical protein